MLKLNGIMNNKPEIRQRDKNLKEKWKGVNDKVPVNYQFVFETEERENSFLMKQFSTKELKAKFKEYRDEWYRRGKELDSGKIPLSVTCELVSTCNLACSMCYTITEKFQNSVIGSKRMLPWKTVKSIIDECAELKVPSMLFSWRGESTLYRQKDDNGKIIRFSDVLKYARKKGILEVASLTHGQLLEGKLAEEVVKAQPNWINFSIDGMFETYNDIRTPVSKRGTNYNAFEKVINNIKNLVKIRNSLGQDLPQIRSNSIYPAIAKNKEEYRDLLIQAGVDLITINEVFDYRWKEVPDNMIMDQWACSFPFQRLVVSANGIILPCTGATNEEKNLVLGRYQGTPPKIIKGIDGKEEKIDVKEISIKKVWQSEQINWVRNHHKNYTRKTITPGCRNCHHGMKKHGYNFIPEKWNTKENEWSEHKTRVR